MRKNKLEKLKEQREKGITEFKKVSKGRPTCIQFTIEGYKRHKWGQKFSELNDKWKKLDQQIRKLENPK